MWTNPPAPPVSEKLTLRSGELEVVLLPTKGADLYSITDRPSGIDVLFKTPWGWRDQRLYASSGDSQQDWLACYPGGWQQLVPNAGAARVVNSVRLGYHGEASTVSWSVDNATSSAATLSVNLSTAPLRLQRKVLLDGPSLEVTDTVRNLSPDPVEFMWVQHPAFGAPFVDQDARLDTSAWTFISDAQSPGTVLPADQITAFPTATGLDGEPMDLRLIPGKDRPREIFGALTDFGSPWFSISSPTAGFGVRLEWDGEIFPHAWFWQELNSTREFPWFRRAYAIAIEPANILPGSGQVGTWMRGRARPLAGGHSQVAQLRFSRIPLNP